MPVWSWELYYTREEEENAIPIKKTTFKVECLKKNLSAEREKITIVLLAGSVGNVSKKHNWINYIFIFLHPFKSENMYFTVVLHFSELYEKFQNYQDALDAPLGITCHIYWGLLWVWYSLSQKITWKRNFKSTK